MTEKKTLGSAQSPQGDKTGADDIETLRAELEKSNKRISDLDRQRSEAQSRADKAAAKAESLEQQYLGKMTEAVERISQNSKPGENDDQAFQRLAEELDKNMDGKMILDLINSYSLDAKDKAKKETLDEISRIIKEKDGTIEELKQSIQAISQKVQDSDPEFVSRKERVAELAEELNLDPVADRALLIKIDKKANPDSEAMGRMPLPGNAASSLIHGSQQDKEQEEWSEEEIQDRARRLNIPVEDVRRYAKEQS